MSRRRWIADQWTADSASLHGEQAEHLARVLRAQVGTEYDVVAGGRVWHGRIASIAGDAVHFDLQTELDASAALPVMLLLSVFKFDRMEWAIEKCIELGAGSIQPVITRRTEKHLAQSAAKRAERWRRIAVEAAKQSRAASVAEIYDPLPIKAALASSFVMEAGARLLLDETERARTFADALRATAPHDFVAIAVGPEGGWADEELALFHAAGWQSTGLGPRILRAETAAICALAIAGSGLLDA